METLERWLLKELRQRGWSQSELARRAEVSTAQVSRVLSGTSDPGYRFCYRVAHALGVPEEQLLRMAGLAEELPKNDTARSWQEFREVFEMLSRESRKNLLSQARALAVYEGQTAYGANFEDR